MQDCTVNDSPLHIKEPTIDDLNRPRQDIPTSHGKSINLSRNIYSCQNMTDCFRQLPLELREEIAISLPTDDFLKLRYVSRSMAVLFESRTFCKTRFFLHDERGFLHDILPLKNQEDVDVLHKRGEERRIDWRLLYHWSNPTTKKTTEGDMRLLTKKEIWQMNEWLVNATLRHVSGNGNEEQCIECSDYSSEIGALTDRHAYSKLTYIGRFIVRIGIFVIQRSGRTFISGFGLFFDNRPNVILGYKSEESHVFETQPLIGFNFAFTEHCSSERIHALQIIANSSTSMWVGRPDFAIDEIREVVFKRLDILRADYDVSPWMCPSTIRSAYWKLRIIDRIQRWSSSKLWERGLKSN